MYPMHILYICYVCYVILYSVCMVGCIYFGQCKTLLLPGEGDDGKVLVNEILGDCIPSTGH